jgi:hypothetical protein
VVRRYPVSTLLVPLLVCGVTAGMAVWGVLNVAATERRHARDDAENAAVVAAGALETSLQALFVPALIMSTYVRVVRDWPVVLASLPSVAADILANSPQGSQVSSVTLLPGGYLGAMVPDQTDTTVPLGYDLYSDPARHDLLQAVAQTREPTLVGPLQSIFNASRYNVVVYSPVFLTNQTGYVQYVPPNGTSGLGLAGGLWGFVGVSLDATALATGRDPRLLAIEAAGYAYVLARAAGPAGAAGVISASASTARQTVTVLVGVANGNWTLSVGRAGGWGPGWTAPVVAAVCVGSLLLLLLLVLPRVWQRREEMLVQTVLPQAVAQHLRRGNAFLDMRADGVMRSPAQVLVAMIDHQLAQNRAAEPSEFSASELVYVRMAIVRSRDIYRPLGLGTALLQEGARRTSWDVTTLLKQMLGIVQDEDAGGTRASLDAPGRRRSGRRGERGSQDEGQDGGPGGGPALSVTPEADAFLAAHLDRFTFDVFRFCDLTDGRPLAAVTLRALQSTGLLRRCRVHEHRLAAFLMEIEEGYYSERPYHNRAHAADVAQTGHVLLQALLKHIDVPPHTQLAFYVAAAVHDYQHPGTSNDFQVRSGSPLALLYNDRSPLENHHLASAFRLLKDRPDLHFMPGKDEAAALRRTVVELVMATDMVQHLPILERFRVAFMGPAGLAPAQPPDRPPQALDAGATQLALQLAIKCADLGHLAESRAVHRRWVDNLEREFYDQGDAEKRMHLGVTPLFDRDKPGVSKSQQAFFDAVALPMFSDLATVFPAARPLHDLALANRRQWTPSNSGGSSGLGRMLSGANSSQSA